MLTAPQGVNQETRLSFGGFLLVPSGTAVLLVLPSCKSFGRPGMHGIPFHMCNLSLSKPVLDSCLVSIWDLEWPSQLAYHGCG